MQHRSDDARSPRFSVVIPALNEAEYLPHCLKSLQTQDTDATVEIIVVDNNSTDGTAAAAREAGVTVVFEPIAGVCQARQAGTEAASGEIIVSADADTVYGPGWLSVIDEHFRQRPELVGVAGPCYFYDGPGWGFRLQQMLFGVVWAVHRVGGPVIYVSATNLAFRKAAWTGYDTRLSQGGDELDLLRRLRKRGTVVFDPKNRTYTSARRMEEGIVYNVAVSFFYYYILGYAVNRVFKRPILGMAPAFRRHVDQAPMVGRAGHLGASVAQSPIGVQPDRVLPDDFPDVVATPPDPVP